MTQIVIGNGAFTIQQEVTSRDLGLLLPRVRQRLVAFISEYRTKMGIELLVICTQRSLMEQAKAKARGASKSDPGLSWHNWGAACDLVPIPGGKPLWTTHNKQGKLLTEWSEFGAIAESCGLTWAGNWTRFIEYGHVQFTDGLRIRDVVANPKLLEKLL